MIAALLLGAAAYVDAYDAVLDAEHAARRCEEYVTRDAWTAPSQSIDARQACSSTWDEYAKARLEYHSKHRRSMRRVVPGFRPALEICWSAFQTELYRWPGMPENTALRDCKNAKN